MVLCCGSSNQSRQPQIILLNGSNMSMVGCAIPKQDVSFRHLSHATMYAPGTSTPLHNGIGEHEKTFRLTKAAAGAPSSFVLTLNDPLNAHMHIAQRATRSTPGHAQKTVLSVLGYRPFNQVKSPEDLSEFALYFKGTSQRTPESIGTITKKQYLTSLNNLKSQLGGTNDGQMRGRAITQLLGSSLGKCFGSNNKIFFEPMLSNYDHVVDATNPAKAATSILKLTRDSLGGKAMGGAFPTLKGSNMFSRCGHCQGKMSNKLCVPCLIGASQVLSGSNFIHPICEDDAGCTETQYCRCGTCADLKGDGEKCNENTDPCSQMRCGAGLQCNYEKGDGIVGRCEPFTNCENDDDCYGLNAYCNPCKVCTRYGRVGWQCDENQDECARDAKVARRCTPGLKCEGGYCKAQFSECAKDTDCKEGSWCRCGQCSEYQKHEGDDCDTRAMECSQVRCCRTEGLSCNHETKKCEKCQPDPYEPPCCKNDAECVIGGNKTWCQCGHCALYRGKNDICSPPNTSECAQVRCQPNEGLTCTKKDGEDKYRCIDENEICCTCKDRPGGDSSTHNSDGSAASA